MMGLVDLPEWHEYGACRGAATDTMFPAAEGRDDRHTKRALAVCEPCPVTDLCLTEGLSYKKVEDYGIRGGTTSRERRRIRNRMADGMTLDEALAVVVPGRKARSQ